MAVDRSAKDSGASIFICIVEVGVVINESFGELNKTFLYAKHEGGGFIDAGIINICAAHNKVSVSVRVIF